MIYQSLIYDTKAYQGISSSNKISCFVAKDVYENYFCEHPIVYLIEKIGFKQFMSGKIILDRKNIQVIKRERPRENTNVRITSAWQLTTRCIFDSKLSGKHKYWPQRILWEWRTE